MFQMVLLFVLLFIVVVGVIYLGYRLWIDVDKEIKREAYHSDMKSWHRDND
jgi:uncharacterized membrane protein YidH (DUF202 family)